MTKRQISNAHLEKYVSTTTVDGFGDLTFKIALEPSGTFWAEPTEDICIVYTESGTEAKGRRVLIIEMRFRISIII
jgi:hypothetical protein